MEGVGESIFVQTMPLEKKNQRVMVGKFLSVCLFYFCPRQQNMGKPKCLWNQTRADAILFKE